MQVLSCNSENQVTPVTPVLTYQAGKFVLSQVPADLRLKLSRSSYWSFTSGSACETIHLRAAVAFRRFACDDTGKILNRVLQAHYDLPTLPPLHFFDPHQIEGLKWVLARKRSYLAHAPGAGKTAQAIAAGCLTEGQVLFIVPPTLVTSWIVELEKFAPLFETWPDIGVVRDSASQSDVAWGAKFVIIPDSMLAKAWVYRQIASRGFAVIGVDEASRFKEATTERSLVFYGGASERKSYPGLYRDARHVVFLDGSPMPNRPMELWAPLYALHPEAIDCMDQDDFGYRYCGPERNAFGKYEFNRSSHEAELKECLRRDFMHVVTESELKHPERLRSIVFIDEDARTVEAKSWERKHLTTLSFDELDEDMSQGDLARARYALGRAKVKPTLKYARERLEKNDKLLIFAWHRDVVEELHQGLSDKGVGCGLIMGGVSDRDRYQAIERFSQGKLQAMVMNIAAGARGLNGLQTANRAIMCEPSWSDQQNIQCEKRGSRRGSVLDLFRSDYMAIRGSMDEPVLSSLFTKQKRFTRIIG